MGNLTYCVHKKPKQHLPVPLRYSLSLLFPAVFLLQVTQVVIHSFHMLRPISFFIRIPGQCLCRQVKLIADFRKFPASPLDVLTLYTFLFKKIS